MKPVTRDTKDWFPEYYLKNITNTDGVLEFYNVLFIKWQDGYVVREGVGRVEKSVWEQAKSQRV